MEALEPLDVQSLKYAEVADCKVDQPPRRPSMTGAMKRSLCPCADSGEEGVDTRMKIRSLTGLNGKRREQRLNESELTLRKAQRSR